MTAYLWSLSTHCRFTNESKQHWWKWKSQQFFSHLWIGEWWKLGSKVVQNNSHYETVPFPNQFVRMERSDKRKSDWSIWRSVGSGTNKFCHWMHAGRNCPRSREKEPYSISETLMIIQPPRLWLRLKSRETFHWGTPCRIWQSKGVAFVSMVHSVSGRMWDFTHQESGKIQCS